MTKWVVYPIMKYQDMGQDDKDDVHAEQDDGKFNYFVHLIEFLLKCKPDSPRLQNDWLFKFTAVKYIHM